MTAPDIARLAAKTLGIYVIAKAIGMMPIMLNAILYWRHPSVNVESFPWLVAAIAGEVALRIALGVVLWYFPDYLMSQSVRGVASSTSHVSGSLPQRVLLAGVAIIGVILLAHGLAGGIGFAAMLIAAQKIMFIAPGEAWSASEFATDKAVFAMNVAKIIIGLVLLLLANGMATNFGFWRRQLKGLKTDS